MNSGVGFLLRVTDVVRHPFKSMGLRLRDHRDRALRDGAAVGVAVKGFAVCRSERHLERMTQRQTAGDGLS